MATLIRTDVSKLQRTHPALECRFADKEHTNATDSQAAINIVLPILIDKGIQSSVSYVKAHSIETISTIVDVTAPEQFAGPTTFRSSGVGLPFCWFCHHASL